MKSFAYFMTVSDLGHFESQIALNPPHICFSKRANHQKQNMTQQFCFTFSNYGLIEQIQRNATPVWLGASEFALFAMA